MIRVFKPFGSANTVGVISHYEEISMSATDKIFQTIQEERTRLSEVQRKIGEWSRANFGDQDSKATITPTKLHELAPLLGMVEEFGEYQDAKNKTELLDALADVGVYLCDYASRTKMDLGVLWSKVTQRIHNRAFRSTIASGLGLLARCNLKRHQGIRGFDDPCVFTSARDFAVVQILAGLETAAQITDDKSIITLVEEVYEKIVAKRNWVASPKDADKVE